MTERIGSVDRKTGETTIQLTLNLDGEGKFKGRCPVRFLDHMLQLFCFHAGFDLELKADGDLDVDDHHLVEDIGLVLGQALARAAGDKVGIERFGGVIQTMDEVLVVVALDLSDRFVYQSDYRAEQERVGDLSTEMVNHFFRSMAVEARATLHLRFLSPGTNEHHRVEAMFKGVARAWKMAVFLGGEGSTLPSTKGVL